ncbi:MAG: zinc ribbon domain-containing protein [Thermodesulfovibrionales bacterium]
MESVEYEGSRKIVGLRVMGILSIILYGLIIFTSFSYADIEIFFLYFIVFGGLIVLASIGLVGLNRRISYAIGVNRAVLILFSFWTGFIPIGLILLLIFWPRLKDIDVKIYLNYPGTAYGYNVMNDNLAKEKIGLPISQNSTKYCYYCGEQLPEEAIFCKKCGKKQD